MMRFGLDDDCIANYREMDQVYHHAEETAVTDQFKCVLLSSLDGNEKTTIRILDAFFSIEAKWCAAAFFCLPDFVKSGIATSHEQLSSPLSDCPCLRFAVFLFASGSAWAAGSTPQIISAISTVSPLPGQITIDGSGFGY
jgi:hypothetical protein